MWYNFKKDAGNGRRRNDVKYCKSVNGKRFGKYISHYCYYRGSRGRGSCHSRRNIQEKEKITKFVEVTVMLVEIRTGSQITLPKEIVDSLGLNEGDKLYVSEKDGIIFMTPVTVYKYLDELQSELSELKRNISEGKPVLDRIDALIEKLEND